VIASNTGGTLTLVGTPTNILVGSFAGLGFNDFLVNLTPGVVFSLLALIGYVMWRYRKEYRSTKRPAARLIRRLEQNARIKDPVKLRKAGIVFGGLLLLFIFGETFHLTPAVSALVGAVVMLLWVHPQIEAMMRVVDWTTLIFFIALFMVIGAVQEIGLIAIIGEQISMLVGENSIVAILVIVWLSTILAGLIDHIPLTAAMLPIVGLLAQSIPGDYTTALYFALAVGAGMGGNSTLIASSANLVTAGIAERAGYKIGFRKFLAASAPATAITVAIASLWLILHFL
jgi:Na+/H+ antiporter NhaD/arsenite permease-like protein